jgi:hypothetical protein
VAYSLLVRSLTHIDEPNARADFQGLVRSLKVEAGFPVFGHLFSLSVHLLSMHIETALCAIATGRFEWRLPWPKWPTFEPNTTAACRHSNALCFSCLGKVNFVRLARKSRPSRDLWLLRRSAFHTDRVAVQYVVRALPGKLITVF